MDNKAILKKQIEDITASAEFQRLSVARHTTSDNQRWNVLNLKLDSLRARLTSIGGSVGSPSQRVLARANKSATSRRNATSSGIEKKSNAFKPEPGVGLGRTGIKPIFVTSGKKTRASVTATPVETSDTDNVLDD